MRNIKSLLLAPVALTVGLAGCATDPYYGSSPQPYGASQQQPYYGGGPRAMQMGYVDRIEVINRSSGNNVAGTIIGGVIGGIIGSQFGGGRGQGVATVAGAIGGAMAGNAIEGRRRADHETFRVTVRLDDGRMQTIVQDNIDDLRTGDRVRVDGNLIFRI